MPSLLNPVVGLLMLRARVEGTGLVGPEVRPGERVRVLAGDGPGPRTYARCRATSRAVRASCASGVTPGRGRDRRAGARWAGRCGSADPRVRSRRTRHRPPCLLR
ncbi:hypothetical protein [Streptomyces sp. NPDC003015]